MRRRNIQKYVKMGWVHSISFGVKSEHFEIWLWKKQKGIIYCSNNDRICIEYDVKEKERCSSWN